jgi:hypothetical protein
VTLNFLRAVLAHALICSIEGDEKQGSARFNRARASHESILRIVDMTMPENFTTSQLNDLYEILDGPVNTLLTEELNKRL